MNTLRAILVGLVLFFTIHTVSALNFTKLCNDVYSAPYNESQYVLNKFDCSNMGSLLYDYLKEKGYGVKFVLVKSYKYGYIYHVLLIVYDKNETDYPISGILYTSNGAKVTLKNGCYWVDPVTKFISQDVKDILRLYFVYDFRTFYVYDDYRETPFPQNEFQY